MSASTKGLQGDKDRKPAPQYFNPVTNDYEYLLGSGGAARHILYDENGNPVDLEGILEVLGLDLTALEGKDFATEATLNSILTKIISSPATAAEQAAIKALIGEVQAIPTANTLLARLKSLEDKIDAITAGTTPVVSQLSGSNLAIAGKKTVGTAGTPELLATNTSCGEGVLIEALDNNTGNVYIFPAAGVKADVRPLVAGDAITWNVANLNALKIDADVSGDGIYWRGAV